ncbi:MAG: hypothetical protein M1830_010179 [Pleopsidium flavum]|nr:MAG: hypothetical protein M1830_010179 [Pleopsidium flavum]
MLQDIRKNVRTDIRDELRRSNIVERREQRTKVAASSKIHRPLAVSPLTAARQQHRTAKTPQGKDLTPFQVKLQLNPYAQALATPVRKCIVTGARVPTFFQIEFRVSNHPDTGRPWFVPGGLDQPQAQLTQPTNNSQVTNRHAIEREAAGITSTHLRSLKIPSSNSVLPFVPLTSRAYMLARQPLLRLVSEKTRRIVGIPRLTPRRWKMERKDIVWREDMDAFVLNMLRRTIVGKLKYLWHRKSGYLSRSREGFDGIQQSKNVGALLWIGTPSAFSEAAKDCSKENPLGARGPPALAMADYHGRYVPIYNLRTMLGDELVNALRWESNLFDLGVIILKARSNTVRTEMLLWKLQLYLATS